MKRIIIILFIALTSCNSAKKEEVIAKKPTINRNFITHFAGKISDKSANLKLTVNDGAVSGSYFIKGSDFKTNVSGTLDSLGNISFGDKKSIFSGEMQSTDKIEGAVAKNNSTSSKAFYFIKTSENYETAFNSSVALFNKELAKKWKKTLVINSISLLSFPATKKSGKAWDNAFASFKPDIYMKITNKEKQIYKYDKVFNNATNNDTPLRFYIGELKINYQDYINGLTIQFIDFDSVTNHDTVGTVTLNTFKKHYDSNMITQVIALNNIKIEISFYYE